MKGVTILAVALAIALAGPASWKWGTHQARADTGVVVMVTTPEGEQFVASTTESEPTGEPYTADVVTADGTSYTGVTVDVLDAAEALAQGSPTTELNLIDSWSW